MLWKLHLFKKNIKLLSVLYTGEKKLPAVAPCAYEKRYLEKFHGKRDIGKISVRRGLRKNNKKHIYVLKTYSRVVDEKERGGEKTQEQSVRHMNTCVQRGRKNFSSWPW